MASEGYHEPYDGLSPATRDMHRALVSLQEELEAADWYQQRVEAAEDEDLKRVLAHNRDEEKEHAAMVLEWIRRKDPVFEAMLRQYLFTEGDITAIEAAIEAQGGPEAATPGEAAPEPAAGGAAEPPPPRLTVGSLMRGK